MCNRCLETVDADIAKVKDNPTPQDRLSLVSSTAQALSTVARALNWIGGEILGKPIVSETLSEGDLREMDGKIRESALILLQEARRLMAKTPCLYDKKQAEAEEKLPPPPSQFST